ncbi:hypothetical protein [Sorangium cellulosum]|nr:hypothetical protein [Sorangium cellulosum]
MLLGSVIMATRLHIANVHHHRGRQAAVPPPRARHLSTPREYRELFAFKVTAFDQIEPSERKQVLEHCVEFARAHVRHLEAQARDVAHASSYGHAPEHRARFADVFEHLVAVWTREAEWASELLVREAAEPSTKRRRATCAARDARPIVKKP